MNDLPIEPISNSVSASTGRRAATSASTVAGEHERVASRSSRRVTPGYRASGRHRRSGVQRVEAAVGVGMSRILPWPTWEYASGGYHRQDMGRARPNANAERASGGGGGRRPVEVDPAVFPDRATRLAIDGGAASARFRDLLDERGPISPTARWARCCSRPASSSAIRPRSGT